MKRPVNRILVIITLFLLAVPACRKQETAISGEVTETIAPASPQPAPTGTDAMTQTVNIETGRSELEGGVAATDTAADTAATATTATGTAPATAPPPAQTTTR